MYYFEKVPNSATLLTALYQRSTNPNAILNTLRYVISFQHVRILPHWLIIYTIYWQVVCFIYPQTCSDRELVPNPGFNTEELIRSKGVSCLCILDALYLTQLLLACTAKEP